MGAITVHAKVDANGVLRLELPLGREAAGRDVRVVVDEAATSKVSPAERRARIRALAGAWEGEFNLPPLAPREIRDPL